MLSFVKSTMHDLPDFCAAPAIIAPIKENKERLGGSFDTIQNANLYSSKQCQNTNLYSGKQCQNTNLYSGKQCQNTNLYSGKQCQNTNLYSSKQ